MEIYLIHYYAYKMKITGWSSDAVLQNKIIEMMENGQLPNVFRDIKARTGGTSSTPLSRETYLRSRIKTI